MKKLLNAAMGCNVKSFNAGQLLQRFGLNTGLPFYLMVLLSTFLYTGCKKQDIQDINEPRSEEKLMNNKAMNTDREFSNFYNGLNWQTLLQLLQARAATARYRNIKHAIKDGYADINVVVENMGYHYMKSAYVDATFEIRRPELLVYNKNEDGSSQLVAVEYAVPIALTPDVAPEGFTGTNDVWERNTSFGLWLLHAWVWYNNPEGVFHDTNPLVHLH